MAHGKYSSSYCSRVEEGCHVPSGIKSRCTSAVSSTVHSGKCRQPEPLPTQYGEEGKSTGYWHQTDVQWAHVSLCSTVHTTDEVE